MRHALFALALAACGSTALPAPGADLSVAADASSVDLAQRPPPDFSGVDLSSLSCLATCQMCQGVCCGAGCCHAGEWCDNGTCRCGGGNGCPTGQMCVSNIFPQNGCGFICCGDGVPCPG